MDAIERTAAPLFDDLPKPTVRKLESCAVNIEKLRSKGVELIFAMGRELKIAHDELANHGDGCFVKWCKERCGISKSTAFNYLSAVDVFGDKDCPSLGRTFTAEALYHLARDTTPQDAIDKAIEAAEKGERITLPKAKQIIEEVIVEVAPSSVGVIDSDEQDEQDDDEEDFADDPPPSPFNLETFGIAERKATDAFRKAFAGWPEEWWPDIDAVLQQLKEGDKSKW